MIFARVFIPVFLLVYTTCVIITFILPESYASTARVTVDGNIVSEYDVIRSDAVLVPAIDKLGLDSSWGRKYNGGHVLNTKDTLLLLKSRLNIVPERNTRLVAITVFSEDKMEAAQIANAIVNSYHAYDSLSQSNSPTAVPKVEIVAVAVPGQRPVRPNKPLNLFIGAVAGILVGSIAGGIVAGLASISRRKSAKA